MLDFLFTIEKFPTFQAQNFTVGLKFDVLDALDEILPILRVVLNH